MKELSIIKRLPDVKKRASLDYCLLFAYTRKNSILGGCILMPKLPPQYMSIQKRYKGFMKAVENLGKATKAAGPLSEKTARLIQLAAAATVRSEGSVHSHTRRAIEAGAKPDEIRHAVILLTSTIGFPSVSAALSWVDDVLEKKRLL
jgi:4-carboxymuconolactone decarboxylase